MLRFDYNGEFEKIPSAEITDNLNTSDSNKDGTSCASDKSPRQVNQQQLSNRRLKGLSKCKNPSLSVEYVDELEKIGYTEPPDPMTLIDQSQYYYAHRSCVAWTMSEQEHPDKVDGLKLIPVILQSLNRKCSYCAHFGASLPCKVMSKR